MVEEANPLESLKAGYWGRTTTDGPSLRDRVYDQSGPNRGQKTVTDTVSELRIRMSSMDQTPQMQGYPGVHL